MKMWEFVARFPSDVERNLFFVSTHHAELPVSCSGGSSDPCFALFTYFLRLLFNLIENAAIDIPAAAV